MALLNIFLVIGVAWFGVVLLESWERNDTTNRLVLRCTRSHTRTRTFTTVLTVMEFVCVSVVCGQERISALLLAPKPICTRTARTYGRPRESFLYRRLTKSRASGLSFIASAAADKT